MTEDSSRRVRWPARYSPETAPVHVRNELEIEAPADVVWAWLVRAQRWPSWYENAADVEFLEGAPPDLAPGVRFKWRTFGVTLESRVLEFVPAERIAWDAQGQGVDAYHAWVIAKTARGSYVLTEESQHGWLARLSHTVTPQRMHHYHQIWLEGLRTQAAGGPPPPPA
jgi:uncharacterized protein YndB with AHSA1/START domain